jgi:hypothetical protein
VGNDFLSSKIVFPESYNRQSSQWTRNLFISDRGDTAGTAASATRVTPLCICDNVPAKESAMFHWLVRLWKKLDGMLRHHAVVPPVSYRRSNLHGRRR